MFRQNHFNPSFNDTSLIEATTPCTDIPKGFTVAIEENNTIMDDSDNAYY